MADGGLPFFRFFDRTDPVIYPAGARYNWLWPEECTLNGFIQDQIMDNFANYFVNSSNPQYWIGRFQLLILREQDKWQKLLDSENALRPQDAIYNYDMEETTNYETSGQSTGSATRTGDNTGYVSETPEGSVSDIASYMSAANKNVTNNNDSTTDSGSSMGNQTVTRKGNIGVMTSAQIIGGYRDAINWCALEEVIFPALEKLFVMIWEGDEGNGYLYAID